jgi:hypothetical protein
MTMAAVGAVLSWPRSADSTGENAMNTMPPTILRDEHPWNKSDPLQFLETLKRNPQKVIAVYDQAPPGWINQHHAEVLLGLLGSKELTSPVLEIKCPSIPQVPSTVGKQAAYLLLGYAADRYPLSGNSDLQYNSDDQIRHLTFERQRSQPMSPETMLFSVARQELRRGESLQATREYKAAIDAYFSGIVKLGNRYRSPDLIDDTEMKRMLAESEKTKGNLETAANLLHNVLESRVQTYQAHHPTVPK